jgi:Transposase DDE domain group 1
LSVCLARLKQRRRGHDPGRVVRDLAVMLADGGECVSDLGATRDQDVLFGPVASDSTAFGTVDRIASTPGILDVVRDAHARARERFWELHGAPESLTIDIDATLIASHPEKERAAGSYKGATGSIRCRRMAMRPPRRCACPATIARCREPTVASDFAIGQ